MDVLKIGAIALAVGFCANSIASSSLTAKDYARKGLKSASFFPGLASLCDISAPPKDMFKLGEKRGKDLSELRAIVNPAAKAKAAAKYLLSKSLITFIT